MRAIRAPIYLTHPLDVKYEVWQSSDLVVDLDFFALEAPMGLEITNPPPLAQVRPSKHAPEGVTQFFLHKLNAPKNNFGGAFAKLDICKIDAVYLCNWLTGTALF